MSKNMLYQVRIKVSEELSNDLRNRNKTNCTSQIYGIAKKCGVIPVCTYDAFADYCKEAESFGIKKYPLYHWTKAAINDPLKKAKHLKSFAFYRGVEQIYPRIKADEIYKELEKLLKIGLIKELKLIDNDPKNNPQPPKSLGAKAN